LTTTVVISHSPHVASATTSRPPFEKYGAWLKKEHGIELSERLRNRYESTARAILLSFESSDLWRESLDQLREFNAQYEVDTGYVLLDPTASPKLSMKPYGSFLLKTYRKNISENEAWPDPPPGMGWIVPIDCMPFINDVVRTSFVVKYLDGVEFLVGRFSELARNHGVDFRADFEAKEEGYYAAHAYVTREFEVPAEKWDTQKARGTIELQVTTQVQELIRRLLHEHYEQRRSALPTTNGKWQWDYKSEEFSTNYLGHILHYVEGMIMDIREKQSSRESTE
jgi:hypothetical protein